MKVGYIEIDATPEELREIFSELQSLLSDNDINSLLHNLMDSKINGSNQDMTTYGLIAIGMLAGSELYRRKLKELIQSSFQIDPKEVL